MPDEHTNTARRLLKSARRRAPSFIFLNMIFNQELEQLTEDETEREAIRDAARQLEKEV